MESCKLEREGDKLNGDGFNPQAVFRRNQENLMLWMYQFYRHIRNPKQRPALLLRSALSNSKVISPSRDTSADHDVT